MLLTARLVALVCLFSAFGFGESWSGVLVDSNCWISEEHNINPRNTTHYVDRDRNLEIRFCAPKAKTKTFVIVPLDGVGFLLDSAGNAKAADLVRVTGKQIIYRVAVTGSVRKDTINVDSIVLAR